MLRLFKYLIILMFCSCFTQIAAASVDKITVTSLGAPLQDENGFFQNIIVSFQAGSSWQLSAIALDSKVPNTSYPQKNLDIQNLRIIDNESSLEYILETGKSIEVKTNATHEKNQGKINVQFRIRLLANETTYPGNYAASIQFNLKANNKEYNEIYTQVFNQPVKQSINIFPATINHTVPPENLLVKGKSIELTQPARIMVRSNIEWELSIINDVPTQLIEQNIRIKTVPEGAKELISPVYQPLKEKELPIVQGKPTVQSGISILQPQVIEVEYQFNTSNSQIIPSSVYPFNIQYKLGEIK